MSIETLRPKRSYLLWFSQRTGSTLLARALEDTGIAGRPREWLNAGSTAELLARHAARDAHALREEIWREGTGDNGVLGIKYGMHAHHHAEVTALLRGIEAESDGAAWEALLPECRHVFMTRRNKVRLAVSWWRAIKSEIWHREGATDDVRPAAATVEDGDYDFAALDHLFAEASLREAAMQSWFDRHGIITDDGGVRGLHRELRGHHPCRARTPRRRGARGPRHRSARPRAARRRALRAVGAALPRRAPTQLVHPRLVSGSHCGARPPQ